MVASIAGSVLFATGTKMKGTSEIVFEAVAMLFAAAMLTWMVFWMRRHSRTMGADLRTKVEVAVVSGSAVALAAVAFFAVVREGLETSLFLFSASRDTNPVETVTGALIGLAGAVVLGALIYRGSTQLNLKRFFQISSIALLAIATWLLFRGLGEIGELIGGEALEIGAIAIVALYVSTVALLTFRQPRLA